MSRGNARQDIVLDDVDREKRLDWLRRTVETYGWRLHAFTLMGNHDLCGAPHKSCYVKLRLMLSCSRRILIFPISRRHCFT